jgi:hypothetical protein
LSGDSSLAFSDPALHRLAHPTSICAVIPAAAEASTLADDVTRLSRAGRPAADVVDDLDEYLFAARTA